jgi:lysophospholipase L1-like esterase
MNLTYLIAGMTLFCLTCVSDQEPCITPDKDPVMNTDPDKGASFLSLGDSYTIGESVPEADRWSVQLADLLRKEGVNVASPDIIARTGWTTAELSSGIQAANKRKDYKLVSLLIGVNNQYQGQSMEQYRAEFKSLLETSVEFAGSRKQRVFVLSIPDWGVSPFGERGDRAKVAREIDAFNSVAQEECKKAGILYIDITPISRTGLGAPSMFATDGLHFSGKMYKLWADTSLPEIKIILSK